MQRQLLVVGTLCVLASAGCFGGGGSRAHLPTDPPRITPWSSIGAARLGMTRDEIERTYGQAIRTERETSYFPFGTRYSGKSLERSEYAVRKGTLRVWYVEGHAKVLETTSPRYRTPGGIRVGLHVRGASCPGSGQAVCVNGFQYDDCTGFLIPASAEGSLDVHLELAGRGYHPRVLKLRGDRLRRIVFGDDDVLLTCF